MHLENTLVMYGIYNVEMLEKLVKTVHALQSRQTLYESLFAGKSSAAYKFYSQMHGSHDIQHYAVNPMLYLRTININTEKYITNLFHNYIYTLRQSEFWPKVIYQFCL